MTGGQWTQVRLSDVARVNPENTPRWDGDRQIRYVDIASVSRDRGISEEVLSPQPFGQAPGRARRVVRDGDVLVSTVRPNLRAFAKVPSTLDGEVASTGFAVVRATGGAIDAGFLWCIIQSEAFAEDMVAKCTGSNYPAIRADDVAAHEFALPTLSEQRRIADLVGALDDHVHSLRIELKATESLCTHLAEELVSGFHPRVLADYLVSIEPGKSPMTSGQPPTPDQDGVLKVSAVVPFKFVPNESKALLPGTSLPDRFLVRPGDVLITRANTPERVGAVCQVPAGVRSGLYLCDKTLRLNVDGGRLDPRFLVVALNTNAARTHLTGTATGTSASMFNISQEKIRSTPIPLPTIEEQRDIAAVVYQALETRDALADEMARCQEVRATVLAALLSQELTIPESYDRLLNEVA